MKLKALLIVLLVSMSKMYGEIHTRSNFTADSELFEENKGQVTGDNSNLVNHIYHQGNFTMFMTNSGIAYQFTKTVYPVDYKPLSKFANKAETECWLEKRKGIKTETYRMDIHLIGANAHPEIISEGKSLDYKMYYSDNILGVHSYSKLIYRNIYKNIDWVIYSRDGKIEYDFVVYPGGDPKDIKIKTKWVEEIEQNENGSIILHNRLGNVQESQPISYQDKTRIHSEFLVNKDVISFKVSNYDKSKKLIIDPVLKWATYYGNDNYQTFNSTATDAAGNVYTAGYTDNSVITNLASGGYQTSFGGLGTNALLVKFDKSGTRLWSTYYGGDNNTFGNSCAVDPIGNVYLAGNTNSSNIFQAMATLGSHQIALNNDLEGFLVKFNSAGARQWGTYYGGDQYENIYSCATDKNANVYVAGTTLTDGILSVNSISVGNGHQLQYNGSGDAFLVKFDSFGTRKWGSYYGGFDFEEGIACMTDNNNNVFLAGMTLSSDSISSSGHQDTFGGIGSSDAFLVGFNSFGARLWGTYYGGTNADVAYSCASDPSGNIYLSGGTSSDDRIHAAGFQATRGGGEDAFLVKFNKNGIRQWGTYYGGSSADRASACVIDNRGNLFMAGGTASSDGIAKFAFQSSIGSISIFDAFLVKFNANSGERKWGTYYGGSGDDFGNSCAADKSYNIYLTGSTASSISGISTTGSHQAAYAGGTADGYLALFNDSIVPTIVINQSAAGSFCMSTKITFTRLITKGGTNPVYHWFKNGNLVGTDTIYIDSTLILNDTIKCRLVSNDSTVVIDSVWSNSIIVDVIPNLYDTLKILICPNEKFFFKADSVTAPGVYRDTLKSSLGCDSFITLELSARTVDTIAYSPASLLICKNDFYFFIDTLVGDSGRHYRKFVNVNGCDSFTYIDITIRKQDTLPIQSDTACSNALPFKFLGKSYFAAGTYYDSALNVNNCYDIYPLNLSIKPAPSKTVIDTTICSNQIYLFNGDTIKFAGTYYDTFPSKNGCDSIIQLVVTMKSISYGRPIDTTVCEFSSYFFNGAFRTTSGAFYDTLVSSTGCDSILTLNLVVLPKIVRNFFFTMCSNDSPRVFFKGKFLDTTGVYSDTLKSVRGCDSFVIVNLTMSKVTIGYDTVKICEGDSAYFKAGKFIKVPGVYYDTMIKGNAKNCDSILGIVLKVLPLRRDTIKRFLCSGLYYIFGKNKDTLRTTGVYYDRIFDTSIVNKKCDSIVVLDLKIGLNKKVYLDNGINFTAAETGVSYQWYYCDPWLKIKNETKKSFTTTTKGSYAVVISDGVCKDTSACIKLYDTAFKTNIYDLGSENIIVYPNPARQNVIIENIQGDRNVHITLYEVLGKKIRDVSFARKERIELDVHDLTTGFYLLHYEAASRSRIFKIEKE